MVKSIHYKAFSWLVIKGMGEFLSLWVLACVTLKVCFWDLVFMWFWESFLTNQVLWRGCFAAFLANVFHVEHSIFGGPISPGCFDSFCVPGQG